MPKNRKVEHIVALKSRFKLEDQFVLFGRARLLADRIVLKGLGFKKIIQLEDIVEVGWIDDRLRIVLEDGEEIPLQIRSAAIWKYELQARCGLEDNTFNSALPDRTGDRERAEDQPSGDAHDPEATHAEGTDAPETPETNSNGAPNRNNYTVSQQFTLPLGDGDQGEQSDVDGLSD